MNDVLTVTKVPTEALLLCFSESRVKIPVKYLFFRMCCCLCLCLLCKLRVYLKIVAMVVRINYDDNFSEGVSN